MRKSLTLMLLAIAVLLCAHTALYARMQAQQAHRPVPLIVDFFDIPGMPIRIDDAVVSASGEEAVLSGSAVNRSSESLVGCHFILLVVGSSGRVRQQYRWSERLVLEGITIKEFSVPVPQRIKLRKGERMLLGIDQVVGRRTLWRAIKGEEALRAYGVGEELEMPEVQQMENYVNGVAG